MMAVGGPIHVPHIASGQEGFDEAVQAAHEQLVKALVELYHKYKVGGRVVTRGQWLPCGLLACAG